MNLRHLQVCVYLFLSTIRGVGPGVYFATLHFRHLHYKFAKTLPIATKTSICFSFDVFYYQLGEFEVWRSTLARLVWL